MGETCIEVHILVKEGRRKKNRKSMVLSKLRRLRRILRQPLTPGMQSYIKFQILNILDEVVKNFELNRRDSNKLLRLQNKIFKVTSRRELMDAINYLLKITSKFA